MVPGYRRTRPPRATRVLMLNQVDDNRRCQNHHAMPALRPQLTPPYRHLLAIDTSTDVLSLALAISDGTANVSAWAITTTSGASGARASAGMVPAIQKLVRDAGLTFTDLDAVVFGQGPGAFTGLRTACAVAQGLAASARPGGIPVVPVNSLLAIAQAARVEQADATARQWTACLDARMGEVYVARYRFDAGLTPVTLPVEIAASGLMTPLALREALTGSTDGLAGNAHAVYADVLADLPAAPVWVSATPSATALLHLTPALWAAGAAVPAAAAMPLYVRDKVAQTTAEREAAKRASTVDPTHG